MHYTSEKTTISFPSEQHIKEYTERLSGTLMDIAGLTPDVLDDGISTCDLCGILGDVAMGVSASSKHIGFADRNVVSLRSMILEINGTSDSRLVDNFMNNLRTIASELQRNKSHRELFMNISIALNDMRIGRGLEGFRPEFSASELGKLLILYLSHKEWHADSSLIYILLDSERLKYDLYEVNSYTLKKGM